jgi:hypothetical protein
VCATGRVVDETIVFAVSRADGGGRWCADDFFFRIPFSPFAIVQQSARTKVFVSYFVRSWDVGVALRCSTEFD